MRNMLNKMNRNKHLFQEKEITLFFNFVVALSHLVAPATVVALTAYPYLNVDKTLVFGYVGVWGVESAGFKRESVCVGVWASVCVRERASAGMNGVSSVGMCVWVFSIERKDE